MLAAYKQLPLPITHHRSSVVAMTTLVRIFFVFVFSLTFFVVVFHMTAAYNDFHRITIDTLGKYSPTKFNPAAALRPESWRSIIRLGSQRSRIGTCTVAHGKHIEGYQRALNTHAEHGNYHSYPTYLLDHPILDGLWSKESALLDVLLQELSKAKNEQLEWLVWFDADTVIMNKLIPLETFLPPEERNDVHLLYTKDWNGLNNGVFILRVSNWSLEFLSSIVAYRSFKPEDKLPFTEQSAMDKVMQLDKYKDGAIECPPQWFNAYPSDGGDKDVHYDHRPGQMLVHFAGIGDKSKAINEWIDKLEKDRTRWEIPLSKTNYEKQIEEFWRGLEEARSQVQTQRTEAGSEKAEKMEAEAVVERVASNIDDNERHVHVDKHKPFSFLKNAAGKTNAAKDPRDHRRELWDGLIL